MATLIEQMKAVAHDPERATSMAHYFREMDDGFAAIAYPPATEAQVATAEAEIGFRLPPLLRDLYLHVGNGGFGPGGGLLPLGIPGGDAEEEEDEEYEDYEPDETLVVLYTAIREGDPDDPKRSWPEGLLPLNDWGCAIRSCLDCTDESLPVLRFDPNGRRAEDSWEDCLTPEGLSLAQWLEAWLDGADLFNTPFAPEKSS